MTSAGQGPPYVDAGQRHTAKFGITRQKDPKSRPERQLATCNGVMNQNRYRPCTYYFIWKGYGYFPARSIEAYMIHSYALTHGGWCPPMQQISCS